MILKTTSYTRNVIFISTDLAEETISTATMVSWQKHFLGTSQLSKRKGGKSCVNIVLHTVAELC